MAIPGLQGCPSIPIEIRRASDVNTIKTVVYSFNMGDVEDPYLYAAYPIYEWQQTKMGKWCMEHMIDKATFICEPDSRTWGYRVAITGEFKEKDYTYFQLKYSGNKS